MLRARRIAIAVALLAILWPLTVSAQATTLLRYAVAFGYQGGTRIAALEATGKWRFDDLPGAYFGQGDTLLIKTVWSPDNRTAYVTYAAPDDGQYRYVYAYDLITRNQTPVVFLNKHGEGSASDYAEISVSPDGRYLWISRSIDQSSRLVDTQAAPNKRVLANIECATELLTWLPEKVLVRGFLQCAYTNFLFDLKTGKPAFRYLQTQEETDLTFGGMVISPAANQLFVLVYNHNMLSKLSLETGQPVKWLNVDWLTVLSDEESAAFVNAGHLFTLDLGTLATVDLGNIGPVQGSYTVGNSLNFWTVEPENAPQTIRRVTVQAGRRSDSTIYSVQAFKQVSFAPNGQGFMLDLGDKGGYQLYDADGKQTWRSLDKDPQIAAQLKFDLAYDAWAGPWYLGTLVGTSTVRGTAPRSFAINATSGRTVVAPEQAPTWVSAAPDNVWWLYTSTICDDEQAKLVAYNIKTSETVSIAKGWCCTHVMLGSPRDRSMPGRPCFRAGNSRPEGPHRPGSKRGVSPDGALAYMEEIRIAPATPPTCGILPPGLGKRASRVRAARIR